MVWTSFRRFFLSLNGSKQNNKVPKCFSPLRNGLERNMEHFYLLQKGSERNYEVPSVQKWLGTELIGAFLSSAEWFRTKLQSSEFHKWFDTEFRAFSIQQTRRNSDGMNPNFCLFCGIIFLSKPYNRFTRIVLGRVGLFVTHLKRFLSKQRKLDVFRFQPNWTL